MKWDSLSKRIGYFDLPMSIVRTYPDQVLKALSSVLIVRAEMMYSTDSIRCEAVSPDFEEVPPYNNPPTYKVMVKNHKLFLGKEE